MGIFEEITGKALKELKERDVVELGMELVKIPSVSGNETPVAEFLVNYMEKAGLDVELQQVTPERAQPRGVVQGTGEGPSLLYLGHIDHAPVPLGFVDPYKPRIEDGVLIGHGLSNMKGGVASSVCAVVAIAKSGVELKGDLIVNPMVGELQSGTGVDWLVKNRPLPDCAVTPHPSQDFNIKTKFSGCLHMAVTTFGKGAHVSRKETGVDAIEKMWKVQKALYEMEREKGWTYEPDPDLPKLPIMGVNSIIGGRGEAYELKGPSDLADHCTVLIDTRFNESMSVESIMRDVKAVLDGLKEEDPDLEYEITLPPLPFGDATHVDPPAHISEEEYMCKSFRKYHEQIYDKPLPVQHLQYGAGQGPSSYGASDIAYFIEVGVPAFVYRCIRRPPAAWSTRGAGTLVSDMVDAAKVMILTALDMCSMTKEEYDRTRILKIANV